MPAHYSRSWQGARSAAVAAGICVAIWQWSASSVVIGVALDTLLLGGVYGLMSTLHATPDHRLEQVVVRSWLIVTSVVAVAAFATFSVPLTLFGLALALLTSPTTLRLRARWSARPPPPPTERDPKP